MLAGPNYLRQSPDVSDPFSDILAFANARSVISGGYTASGAWSVRFPRPTKLKFFAVVEGGCWLRIDGAKPLRICAGEVFSLSPAQRGFVLASDLELAPVDAARLFTPGSGAVVDLSPAGHDCFVLGGHVELDPASGGLLAEVLPPLIHLRAASPQARVVQWLLAELVRERVANLPGSSAASNQLAQLMFVQLMRVHLAEADARTPGLLRAISDPRLAPALRLMHGEPGRAWTLGELAKAAAMSRSTFALHFKTVAGVAPLAYLTRWRMRLAERTLRDDATSIAELARSLGYASDSAFSNAFKRELGVSPKRCRDAARGAVMAPEHRDGLAA
jgi:AraC-like DNA-binding protein